MTDYIFDSEKVPVVIMSLNHSGNVEEERDILNKAGFTRHKPVLGKYKGELEMSYVVPVRSPEEIDRLKLLAKDYNQECIMFIDSDRQATLFYCKDPIIKYIGKLKTVYKHLAERQDYYTFCPISNAYYIVEMPYDSTRV